MSRFAKILVLALVVMSGCVMSDEGDGDELLLRVQFSGQSISEVEVFDRGAPGDFEDALRPQMNGETGILWTDYATGETLAEGWRDGVTDELYLVVPAPTAGEGLLTIALPTEYGPFVVTSYLEILSGLALHRAPRFR